MADIKRIMISLPNSLLKEVDVIVASERLNRSEFIREAMKLYIDERKRKVIRDQMIQGYSEMAAINLNIANENLAEDEELKAACWQIAEGE
ncbi:MAG TPA: ribbon-helix-helix protein, CopG family [Bacillota bacterium]|nr:ribbon-helix-helix protein, CopG family [Bacillota bacterium]